MFVEYLSFGRPSEFIVQSMVLSLLFLIAGRVWTLPEILVSLGTRNEVVGLLLTALIISSSVGVVVYLSGKRTYSPLFNQLRHCVITAILHIVLGTLLAAGMCLYLFLIFGMETSWPLIKISSSLFLIGSLYALAAAAWHYQRVLAVDYGNGSFEAAVQEFLQSVEKFDQGQNQVQEEVLTEISEAIQLLDRHCAKPKLADEKELKSDIETLRADFIHERADIQDIVVRGQYWEGSPLEGELNELAQAFYRVHRNLRLIR